ncbi:cytochrome P450 2U1-like [Patiria miniata]|uniref:Cytochrome P450 n=1 Tax=Patiria miniata TaxID=46514 RepID=A0A914ANP8_PATMI|nr:cytochrome P450 2U1-like [Patiria miniata]XP_038065373.1 cytochrome P450 2U1-like [Patiria miniata]
MYATISRWIVSTKASLHLLSLAAVLLGAVLVLAHRSSSRLRGANAAQPRPSGRPLPGPRSWPLVGSIPAIVWYTKHYGHRAFTEIARRHGAVFGLRLAPGQLLVVLNDRSSIREAFVKQAARMNNRHLQGLVKVSFPVQGSLAWENGEIWAARRKFILRAFRTLGFSKSGILGQRIQEEAAALCRSIDKYGGSPFDPQHLLECATSNLFCAIALGDRYEYESPTLHSLVRNSKIVLDNLSAVSIGNCLPFLYHTPVCREYRDAVTGLTDFIRDLVDQHKVTYNNCNRPRDVVDLYLAEVSRRQEEGEGLKFEEEDVWRSMLDILIAGSFSTATHVLWTLLFITQYKSVQQRIHDEIDSAIGRDRLPSLDDSPLLPYTRATLFEIQRCRIATVSVPHLASEDAAVGGCLIPKGAQVLANFWALHHDPREWKEPELFDPCRFLSKDESAVIMTENFMPFGVGPRMCPGEQFAKHQAFLIFASIMQRYRLTISPTDPTPDLEGAVCGPALHPEAFRICAQLR